MRELPALIRPSNSSKDLASHTSPPHSATPRCADTSAIPYNEHSGPQHLFLSVQTSNPQPTFLFQPVSDLNYAMLLLRQPPTPSTRDTHFPATTSSGIDRMHAVRMPSTGGACPRLHCSSSASRHQSSLLASGSTATMSAAPSQSTASSTPTNEDRMAEEYNKTMAHAMKVGSGDLGLFQSSTTVWNSTCYYCIGGLTAAALLPSASSIGPGHW